MREHPIPQDITNYRFHIIGSMTLKQFAEIFLGVIGALIIYSTNLPDILKWILILSSIGLGAGAAFVPIEERPLDHWIITFFKVLYKPTKFFWKRTPKLPEPFLYIPRSDQEPLEPELDLTPAKRARIKEYLTSVNTPSEYQSDLTDWEASRIQQITESFSTTPVQQTTTKPSPAKQQEKPNVTVRVRNLRSDAFSVNKSNNEVTIYGGNKPAQNTTQNQMPAVELSQLETTTNSTSTSTPAPQAQNTPNEPPEVVTQAPNQQNQLDQRVSIPENQVVQVQRQQPNTNQQNQDNQEPAAAPAQTSQFSYVENQKTKKQKKQAHDAAYNQDLPFPDPPTEPNKVVGMVLSPNNELITNAIVEIQTEDGQIVRAVKSNALGQFFITTPLKNGTYIVEVEKDGFSFNPQKIELSGEPVAPLEIRSV